MRDLILGHLTAVVHHFLIVDIEMRNTTCMEILIRVCCLILIAYCCLHLLKWLRDLRNCYVEILLQWKKIVTHLTYLTTSVVHVWKLKIGQPLRILVKETLVTSEVINQTVIYLSLIL